MMRGIYSKCMEKISDLTEEDVWRIGLERAEARHHSLHELVTVCIALRKDGVGEVHELGARGFSVEVVRHDSYLVLDVGFADLSEREERGWRCTEADAPG